MSPGTQEAGALIGDPCPNFSWGAVDGAQRYELAIFDAQWQDSPAYDVQRSQGLALRQIEISAPALSWTPAGNDCLDEGGSYLWFVRAQTADADGPWSAPRYFEIDYDADALTQTVRRELTAQLSRPEVWRDVIQSALSTNGRLELTPLALRGVATVAPAADTGEAGAGPGRSEATKAPDTLASTTATFNPLALRISSAKGVVFDDPTANPLISPPGSGGIPAAGAGTRFMWYPGKAALRAGYVSGVQWDDSNIGNYSVALGYSTTASGGFSMALGANTTASGYISTALGARTTASGESSTALGYVTTASGSGSTALGDSTTASGHWSTALGLATYARSYAELAIGVYNSDYLPTSTTEWAGTDRLFVIGNGNPAVGTRSNAMVVLKSGNVGISTNTPGYLLELGTDSAAKPGTTTWKIASDARLKAISGPYDRGLEAIAALQPVRYHYAVGNARGHDPAPEYVGFIAQQAQEVFPEAVSEGADGYLDFNMHAVNVAMVNAIQTLREQNLALEAQLQTQVDQHQAQEVRFQAQIADLRADKAALAQRLASLEAENARLSRLQADLAQLQAQLQVLQGQMAAAASRGQLALGR